MRMMSGSARPLRAAIDLAGSGADDVRAEVVIGRVDSNGHLEETEVIVLPAWSKSRVRRRVCEGYHAGTDGPSRLRIAGQPESLRRSTYAACDSA